MILRGEVEFAVADFYITSNRKKVVDFSPALMQQWYVFTIKSYEELELNFTQ